MTTTWYKVSYTSELREFERVATDIAGVKLKNQQQWNATFTDLTRKYTTSAPVTLTDAIWRNLQDSDSWDTFTMSKIKQAIQRKRSSNANRDPYAVMKEILSGRPRCPIILHRENTYSVIAGNTRLMVCRMLEIQPTVVIVKL